MTHPSPRIGICSYVLFALVSGCGSSGGGGGGESTGPTAADVSLAKSLAGNWIVQATVTSTDCPNEAVGQALLLPVTVSVDDGSTVVRIDDGEGTIAGTLASASLVARRSNTNGTVELNLTSVSADSVVGTLTQERMGPPACTSAYTVELKRREPAPPLAGLSIPGAILSPAFDPNTLNYSASVGHFSQLTQLVATAQGDMDRITLQTEGQPDNALMSGATSIPVMLEVGTTTLSLRVEPPAPSVDSTVYTIEVTRRTADELAQEAYIKASNPDAGDRFGFAVAFDGDTLVVSADREDSFGRGVDVRQDNGAESSGAVYVFVREDGSWRQQAYIKALNSDAGDRFGSSLAIQGNTLVVGAAGENGGTSGFGGDPFNNSSPDSGAAYVFERDGETWAQVAYLKASNTDPFDAFGHSVAIDGETIAVGAIAEDSSSSGIDGDQGNGSYRVGAVYVFRGAGATWEQEAYIKASNSGYDDQFGTTIAIEGETLVVGAPLEDSATTGPMPGQTIQNLNGNNNDAPESGAVYVFTRNGTTWSEQAYIKPTDTSTGSAFGSSIALANSILIVGAPGADVSGANSGAAYVFRWSGGWYQDRILQPAVISPGDAFGTDVALFSVQGMTTDFLMVSSREEDGNGAGLNSDAENDAANGAGASYAFRATGMTGDGIQWPQISFLKASNPAAMDYFGTRLAFGGAGLAVAAPGEASSTTGVNGDQGNDSVAEAGAVYVFR